MVAKKRVAVTRLPPNDCFLYVRNIQYLQQNERLCEVLVLILEQRIHFNNRCLPS